MPVQMEILDSAFVQKTGERAQTRMSATGRYDGVVWYVRIIFLYDNDDITNDKIKCRHDSQVSSIQHAMYYRMWQPCESPTGSNNVGRRPMERIEGSGGVEGVLVLNRHILPEKEML